MRRIFDAYAYGPGPRAGCWWDHTCAIPDAAVARGVLTCDVAVVGGGFTGLTAALHLARSGMDVAVFDAQQPGWGASGRNGGFCCLGGGRIDNKTLESRFGPQGRAEYRAAEVAAVDLVAETLNLEKINADRHSVGETELAHRPKDAEVLKRQAAQVAADYGVEPVLHDKSDLEAAGMAGPFHAGLTIPIGFGLNPRKYVAGLAAAALRAGARLYAPAPVSGIQRNAVGFTLQAGNAQVAARKVLIATNGYSSEDLPNWLSGRYMPSQSSVIVTRPLSDEEIAAQGWYSDQMAYDSRNLLHYFRLMPDRRLLFGMRGGLLTGPTAQTRSIRKVRRDFEAMFPAWRGVETPHAWSGMVCLARRMLPFVGPVPGQQGMFAGLAFHGNGVAMGSYAGRLLADLMCGNEPDYPYPQAMQQPLARFPLGRFRRALMPAAYAAFALADR